MRGRSSGIAPASFGLAALVLLAAFPSRAEPLIVIDPGHGGSKPGAKNADQETEASIVLGIGRLLKAELEKHSIRVVLTRDQDVHPPLAGRARTANQLEADAFVSLHANWSPVVARRGAETYILSAEASDEDAAALLEFEEAEEGPPEEEAAPDEPSGDVEAILQDLKRAAAHAESARLARVIQDELGTVKALTPSRGLRQAPFLVLRKATVPAVLVELGYLSHPEQGRALAGRAAQVETARALARALVRYVQSRG